MQLVEQVNPQAWERASSQTLEACEELHQTAHRCRVQVRHPGHPVKDEDQHTFCSRKGM